MILPSPNFISSPTINVSAKNILRPCNLSGTIPCLSNKRDFPSPAVSSASWPQTDVGYKSEFEERGVTVTGIGDSFVVKMALENGTAANLILPSGLITSFKPQMWHGGTMELLHTSVSAGEDGGGAVVRGGLSLAVGCNNNGGGVSWSPSTWALHQVTGSPQESIRVELISKEGECNAEVKHIITLGQDLLASEIIVCSSTSSLHLSGSIMCHLAVSTPDAAYAIGLERSDFLIRQPFVANFSIIPPDFKRADQDSRKFWGLNKIFSKWDARKGNVGDDVEILLRDVKEELEGEEEDNYKHLTERLSRIYTGAPRNLNIIDRGRRNSVTVRRNGFKELYMFSPGSEYEYYNKYSYICIGHAALREPIILNAQSEWRGGLQLWNPNT